MRGRVRQVCRVFGFLHSFHPFKSPLLLHMRTNRILGHSGNATCNWNCFRFCMSKSESNSATCRFEYIALRMIVPRYNSSQGRALMHEPQETIWQVKWWWPWDKRTRYMGGHSSMHSGRLRRKSVRGIIWKTYSYEWISTHLGMHWCIDVCLHVEMYGISVWVWSGVCMSMDMDINGQKIID